MWFNNLQIYRIALDLDLDDLEEQLSRGLYAGCGTHQATSRGWVAPTGNPCDPLVYSQGRQFLLALRSDQRLLPGSGRRSGTCDLGLAIRRRLAGLELRKAEDLTAEGRDGSLRAAEL